MVSAFTCSMRILSLDMGWNGRTVANDLLRRDISNSAYSTNYIVCHVTIRAIKHQSPLIKRRDIFHGAITGMFSLKVNGGIFNMYE